MFGLSPLRLSYRFAHVEHERDADDLRHDLPEHLQQLSLYLCGKGAQAGHVAPRTPHAGDDASTNGIATRGHDDRYRPRGVLGRQRCWRSSRHDDVHLESNQASCEIGEPLSVAVGGAVLDHKVLAFDVAEFLKALAERGEIRRV